MKLIGGVLLLVLLAEKFVQTEQARHLLNQAWNGFKDTFKKNYDTPEEEALRRSIWERHVSNITIHNLKFDYARTGFNQGINQYSDLSIVEKIEQLLGFIRPDDGAITFQKIVRTNPPPKKMDWRTKGYMAEVKNQRGCAAGWASAATGALEGQNFRVNGVLVSFSEQNLIDCSTEQGNSGCYGGNHFGAFDYMISKGLNPTSAYPFQAQAGACAFDPSNSNNAKVKKYVAIAQDENSLMAAVGTLGPVAVAIDAGHNSFFNYRSGLYTEPDCTQNVNHVVLVVGYGTTPRGQDFWLIKNNWGLSWGTKGYMMMARNKNLCGIATYAGYPVL